jgi:hypothetical protein
LICTQNPGGSLAAVALGSGSSWTLLNWVASWESIKHAINVLIDARRVGALLHLGVGQEFEVVCAIFDNTRVLRALVNSALEGVSIPAIEEIYCPKNEIRKENEVR